MAKPNKQAAFLISHKQQVIFVAVVAAIWLTSFAYLIAWSLGDYFSSGNLIYQITQAGVPWLWFLAALWYVWPKYSSRMHKLFAAMLLAFIGFGIFNIVSQIESVLRYKYFPPTNQTPGDTGLLMAFGHEWLIMGIGMALFVCIVAWSKYHRKAR